MSFPYTEVNTFAYEYIVPGIKDQIYKNNILTKRLMEKGKIVVDGGDGLDVNLEFDKANGQNFEGKYDTITPSYKKTIDHAKFDWKKKIIHTTITDDDKLRCAGSAQKIASLATTRTKGLVKKLEDMIGDGIYSDGTTDTLELTGLRYAIASDSTYGEIAQSTYTWWAGGVDSSTATVTPDVLQTGFSTCYDSSKKYPTIGITTQTIFNLVWKLFQPQQRYMGDTANVGWTQSIPYGSVPIVPDAKCPASHFFWLNEDSIKLLVSKEFDSEFVPWGPMPNQPSAYVAWLKWVGELIVDEPRTCYKYSALTA